VVTRFAPRKIILYLVLVVLTLAWLLPVVSSFLASFKSSKDFVSQTWAGLPTRFYFFVNLATVLREYRIQDNLVSSFLYSTSATLVVIVTAAMAGFSIVRLRPRFNFLLFNVLGLHDTRIGMILIYAALAIPFSLFVYRGFYTTIPREIEEATKLDGCGPARSFVSVFLPQSLPPTAVVALFQATWIRNDLLFGMVLSRTQNVRPVMVAVATMTGYGGGNIPWIMTAVIFTSIPTILLFVWLRRYFIQGMVLSVQA
jgi:multiple sugar transport system permease protein